MYLPILCVYMNFLDKIRFMFYIIYYVYATFKGNEEQGVNKIEIVF